MTHSTDGTVQGREILLRRGSELCSDGGAESEMGWDDGPSGRGGGGGWIRSGDQAHSHVCHC